MGRQRMWAERATYLIRQLALLVATFPKGEGSRGSGIARAGAKSRFSIDFCYKKCIIKEKNRS